MAQRQEDDAGSPRPSSSSRVVTIAAADLDAVEADTGAFGPGAVRAGEKLDRLEHDVALREELAAGNYEGPSWDRFADELARYGHAVVLAWCRSGEIFAQCRKKFCSPGPRPATWTDEDRQSITNDTVAHAIAFFRTKALAEGGWDPARRATLKSFFIGRCVLSFANQFRRWETDHKAHLALSAATADDDVLNRIRSPSRDPGQRLVDAAHVREELAGIGDERTATMIVLRDEGYSNIEIGELFGLSAGAVKQIFVRYKARRERDNGSTGREESKGGSDG